MNSYYKDSYISKMNATLTLLNLSDFIICAAEIKC